MSERLTPETAAALAAELRERGEALIREGEALIAESEVIEGYAEGLRRLQGRHQSGTAKGMTTAAARAHISKGRSKQARGEVHPLIEKASAKGHTLRSLAAAVEAETKQKCSHAALSRGISGDRPIRKSHADVVERLTGYKATAAHWPGGWSSED